MRFFGIPPSVQCILFMPTLVNLTLPLPRALAYLNNTQRQPFQCKI